MLALYRELLALRRSEAALHAGTFEAIDGTPVDLLAYFRTSGARRLIVLLNVGASDLAVPAAVLSGNAQVLLSTAAGTVPTSGGGLHLRPFEGVVAVR